MVGSVVKHVISSFLDRKRQSIEKANAVDVHYLLGGEIMTMVDVGASGGILPRWEPYRQDLSFVGLEPDSRSYKDLIDSPAARAFRSYKLIPCGAWDVEGTVKISFTAKPMCSSHFQPNFGFLSRFPDAERFSVVGSAEVSCQRLDSLWPELGDATDFIKLDLEGGELAVLKGAENILNSCFGLHVEVGFQQMRSGQPLFGDVSSFLSQRGFEFIDFVTIMRWERRHFREAGQAVFGDALFLRSPECVMDLIKSGTIPASRAKRYVAVLAVYDRWDLVERFLEMAEETSCVDLAYRTQAKAVVTRRLGDLAKRVKLLARLSFIYSRITNPNSSLHYIY